MMNESTGNFSSTRNMYDWYQNNSHVIINVPVKNLKEADVKVKLIDETLDVTCNLADGNIFKLHFDLYKPIYVQDSNWTVTPSKLEIKLKKTDRKRWQSLEHIPGKCPKRHAISTRNVYDWFQTDTHVIINVPTKNLKEADVNIKIIDETLDATCYLADGNILKLHFDLYKTIDAQESNWSVTPSKLEIRLKKNDRKRWPSLEHAPGKVL